MSTLQRQLDNMIGGMLALQETVPLPQPPITARLTNRKCANTGSDARSATHSPSENRCRAGAILPGSVTIGSAGPHHRNCRACPTPASGQSIVETGMGREVQPRERNGGCQLTTRARRLVQFLCSTQALQQQVDHCYCMRIVQCEMVLCCKSTGACAAGRNGGAGSHRCRIAAPSGAAQATCTNVGMPYGNVSSM